jgi:hypothetical protein
MSDVKLYCSFGGNGFLAGYDNSFSDKITNKTYNGVISILAGGEGSTKVHGHPFPWF